MKNLIVKNLLSNYLLSSFGMALGFLLVPFLIGKLGKEAFGLIVLAEATMVFFEIVTASVRVALSRHSTFSLSQGKNDEFLEYLSTGRAILLISAVVVFTVGTFISYRFTHLFTVPPEYFFQSRLLFFLITLSATISIPNIVYWSVLYAKQRFDLINLSSSTGLVVRALSLFIYYSLAPKKYAYLAVYGLIYFAMTLMQNSMIYFFQKKMMAGVRISIKHFRQSKIRSILSFSVHTAMARASTALYQDTATIIINIFWGPAFNTLYAIGMKIPTALNRVFVEPSWALTPTFTDLAARNDHERFETLFFMYSKTLAIVVFPLFFTLIFFSGPIIKLWVGPGYATAAVILSVSMGQALISVPFSLTWSVFNAYGKVKIPSLISLLMGIMNLGLCLWLGVVLNMKLYGILLAFVIAGTVSGEIIFPAYACRMAGFSLKRYWMNSLLKPFFLCCLFVGGGILVLKVFESHLILSPLTLGVLALCAGVYYLLSYKILLAASEKKYISDILRMKFGKITARS